MGALGYYPLLLYTQLVGLGPLFLLFAIFGFPAPSLMSVALVLMTGVCSTSSIFFSFKGLSVGKASIITSVGASSTVLALILSFVILGETISIPQIMCVASVLIGIAMISLRFPPGKQSEEGIFYTVVSMLSRGANAILFKLTSMEALSLNSSLCYS